MVSMPPGAAVARGKAGRVDLETTEAVLAAPQLSAASGGWQGRELPPHLESVWLELGRFSRHTRAQELGS